MIILFFSDLAQFKQYKNK